MTRLLVALILSTVGVLGQTCIGNNAVDWAGLLVYWKMNEGSGQFVRNYVHPEDAHANMVSFPEQYFSRSTFYTLTGVTATDRVAVGPNGFTNASEIVATSSSRFIGQSGHAFTGTPYTMSVWAKSATGSDQTWRFAANDGSLHYSPTMTATNGWARFTWTWTATAGSGNTIYIISDASNNDYDIFIWGWQLENAASASTYEAPNFHAMIGTRTLTDSQDTSWNAQGLDCTGSHYASSISSTPYALSNWTAYAMVKWTTDPVFNSYCYPLSTQNNGNYLGLATQGNATRSPLMCSVGGSVCLLTGVSGSRAFAEPVKNEWHIIAASYDGSNLYVYFDGQLCQSMTQAGYVFALNTLFIGNFNYVAFWPGYVSSILLYSTAHTQSTVFRNCSAMRKRLVNKGGVFGSTRFVAFEGDSITLMDAAYYPYFCMTNPPSLCGKQFAVSGSTISDLVSRRSTVNGYNFPNGMKRILSVLIGANDLGTLGAATWTANLKAYCLAMRASGWKIVLCTVLPRTAVGFNTERATANANIHADPSFYDAIADLAADPTIGCDACAADLTYYSDGTHPTAAGQAIIGPIVRAAIDSL